MSSCYVYIIKCSDLPYYKIGIATNAEARLRNVQSASPFALQLIVKREFITKQAARFIERAMHLLFSKYCIRLEWFCFDSKTIKRVVTSLKNCDEPDFEESQAVTVYDKSITRQCEACKKVKELNDFVSLNNWISGWCSGCRQTEAYRVAGLSTESWETRKNLPIGNSYSYLI